ncbi:MAG: chromate transporter [Caulobacteraceae bacterium]
MPIRPVGGLEIRRLQLHKRRMETVQDAAAPPAAGRPDARALFFAFLAIGMAGFGGVLPFARRGLVESKGWLTAEDFNETLALCQSLPGPNVVNLSVVVGSRFAGASGAGAALAGLVGVPVALVLVLGALYGRFAATGRLPGVMAGLAAAAAGLVAATAVRMAAPLVARRPASGGVFLSLAFAGVGPMSLPLPWVLLALGPVSIAVAWARRP